ncbi:MAG TPA: M20 family metallopeptidase [Burkholderiales bacterium]|nr:M20 family metallopeptidase [Burkholderiales bacterium]
MGAIDAISLTKSLLRFDTINPPGRERDCAHYSGRLLEEWGFRVDYHEYDDARTSVVARAGGVEGRAPLCLTGHIDTVALGAAPWTKDAFSGETEGDRLYGRGSSDMKAGVAAILLAARAFAARLSGTPGLVLVLTAGEEGGCIGSSHLARSPLLGRAGAIVVGEPTSNQPYVGHKGSLKFHARFRGVSAHGSMPELGVNAVYKAARAIAALEKLAQEESFRAPRHPLMGEPTLNVGTVQGGDGINMVPDWAAVGVDVRTVPGVDHAALLARLKEALGEAEVRVLSDLPPVWTPPENEWLQRAIEICARHLGARPQPRTATYMTDAANLLKAYRGAPTVVLGPGEPQMAHQTDEYCSQERIRQAVAIYEALIADWCAG